MNTRRWRKQHKWVGLLFSFFILMFCISGIVLNHRTLFADYNISRKWLPEAYCFKNWNGGLLRGAIRYNHSVPGSILLYGNSGIWQTDSTASTIKDFNAGLPEGADYRQIRSMAATPDDQLFAVDNLMYSALIRTKECGKRFHWLQHNTNALPT